MPFEPNKTIKELGIDTTRKFRVVDNFGSGDTKLGDILILQKDDGSCNPYFTNLTQNNACSAIHLDGLEYATDVAADKPHKFKVGDIITINNGAMTLEFGDEDYYRRQFPDKSFIPASEFLMTERSSGIPEETNPMFINVGGKTLTIKTKLNNNNNTPPSSPRTGDGIKKVMTKIVDFFSDLSISAYDKELRQAGLVDENLNWTESSLAIVTNLEAKERGYKNFAELTSKICYASGGSNVITPLEAETLYKKFYTQLLEQAKAFNLANKSK